MIYIGKNAKAAAAVALKAGDGSGKAKTVVGGWVGDPQGKARRFWSLERPTWKFTCQIGVNLHVSGRDLEIDYGDGSGENIGAQTSAYHISHAYADTEPHQVTLYGVLTHLRFWDDDGESTMNYLLSVDTPFPENRIASFNNTFCFCTSLATIPAGLFDNCTAVTSFDHTFSDCTSLTAIPAGLFDNCTAVTSFDHTFFSCTSLAAIPAGLFDNCTAVTEFGYTFSDCTSLTAIPAGLFDNCTAVTAFGGTFFNCTSLTAIPAGLFDNCTAVTSFSGTFFNCTSFTAIPSGLFDNCTAVTNFYNTFRNCTAITGAVPELWNTAKWPNVTSHAGCFNGCINAANYADIPAAWR